MRKTLGFLADRLTGLAAIIGTLGLLLEVGVILIDVIGRALGNPLYGSQDMITMTMVLVVFGGMALADKRGGHIAVDLFERQFSPAFNRVLDIATAILGAIIFTALAWAVWESAKLSVMLNLSTNLIGLQKAWFQWALSALSLIAAFGMALRTLNLLLPTHEEPS